MRREELTWLRCPKRIVTDTTPHQCIYTASYKVMPGQASDGSWTKRQHTHSICTQVIANQKRVNDFNIYDKKYTYNDCLDKRGRSE